MKRGYVAPVIEIKGAEDVITTSTGVETERVPFFANRSGTDFYDVLPLGTGNDDIFNV